LKSLKRTTIALLCIFTVTCCKESGHCADYQDQLIENLKEKYSEIGVDVKALDHSDQILNANWLITTSQCDLIIVDKLIKQSNL